MHSEIRDNSKTDQYMNYQEGISIRDWVTYDKNEGMEQLDGVK